MRVAILRKKFFLTFAQMCSILRAADENLIRSSILGTKAFWEVSF